MSGYPQNFPYLFHAGEYPPPPTHPSGQPPVSHQQHQHQQQQPLDTYLRSFPPLAYSSFPQPNPSNFLQPMGNVPPPPEFWNTNPQAQLNPPMASALPGLSHFPFASQQQDVITPSSSHSNLRAGAIVSTVPAQPTTVGQHGFVHNQPPVTHRDAASFQPQGFAQNQWNEESGQRMSIGGHDVEIESSLQNERDRAFHRSDSVVQYPAVSDPSQNQQKISSQASISRQDGPAVDDRSSGAMLDHKMQQSSSLKPLEVPYSSSTNETLTNSTLQSSSTRATSQPVTAEHLNRERKKAKDFIYVLHQNGINFRDVVLEAPDLDSSFLRGIYQEIGLDTEDSIVENQSGNKGIQMMEDISYSPSQPALVPTTRVKPLQSSRTSDGTHGYSPISAASQIQSSMSQQPIQADENKATQEVSQEKPSNMQGPQIAEQTKEKQLSESSKHKESEAANVSPVSTNRALPSTISKTASQPKDRQDYIARLMAAKTKKSTADNVTQNKRPTPETEIHGPNVARASDQNESTIDINNSLSTTSLDDQKDVEKRAAEKRKAQTELARRKMEELKAARLSAGAKDTAVDSSTKMTSASQQMGSIAQSLGPEQRLPWLFDYNKLPPGFQSADTTSTVDNPLIQSNATLQPFQDPHVSQISQRLGSDRPPLSGGIPGLFMTTSSKSSSNNFVGSFKRQETTESSSQTPEDVQYYSGMSRAPTRESGDGLQTNLTSRPFGQSDDDEDMIIEASDDEMSYNDSDEEEEEGMIVEEVSRSRDAYGVHTMETNLHDGRPFQERSRAVEKDPAAHDLVSAPPGHDNLKVAASGSRDLEYQEAQILKMKQKIAEMEEKKKTRALNSGAATPDSTSKVSLANQRVVDTLYEDYPVAERAPFPPRVESSAKPSSPRDSGVDDMRVTSKSLMQVYDEETEETASAAPVTRSSVPDDFRTRRKAEIESNLPTLDARYATNSTRLELLRAQMKELEDAMQKEREERESLVAELESLGVNTEGMPHHELQATRDEIMATTKSAEDTDALDEFSENVPMDESHSDRSGSSMSMDMQVDDSPEETTHYGQDQDVALQGNGDNSRRYSDEAAPIPLPNPPPSAQNVQGTGQNSFPEESPHDFQSPAYTEYVADDSSLSSIDQIMAQETGSESGEIRSSESDGELRYKQAPAPEARLDHEVTGRVSEFHTRLDDTVLDPSSDEYEPPDVQSSEPARYSVKESQDAPELEHSTERPQPGYTMPSSDSQVSNASNSAGVDETLDAAAADNEVAEDSVVRFDGLLPRETERFTPYESPLKTFKAYRNHPEFDQLVAGGFRSMTYSHNIDPDQPLCPFEAAGGTCNDSTCDFQHFRSLNLTDDVILLQLGRNNPGQTEEQKQAWAEDLQALLQDLRQRQVNDTRAVATEIAALRRRFYNDPSRILGV